MLKILLTAFAAISLCACALGDQVDDFVKKEMSRQHIPGLSIAVLIGDKVVKIKGYGEANLELSAAAKPETRYEIGSITKQFTATAIMLLVEQGKVALDEKISKYLPGSPDTWKEITVRNLLNHTSGIKNYTALPDFAGKMRQDTTRDEAFKYIAAQPLDFAAGTDWRYSNSGYFLLGMIVESVTGELYGSFLRDHIFGPCGMTHTCVNDPGAVLADRASGYEWSNGAWRNAPFISMTWPYSAGAVISCAEDFAKWTQALNAQKLLKQSSYEAMYTRAKLTNGNTEPYGFGWDLNPFRGHPKISHDGGIPGFLTDYVRWPKDDLAVVVFTNSGNCDPDEIATGISGLYIPALKPLPLLEPKHDANPAVTAILKDLIVHFGKNDDNVDGVSDSMKKVLTPVTQQIFKGIGDHMKDLLYLDEDEPTPSGNKTIYYRITRDDGIQFATVVEDKDGKIVGVIVDAVHSV